ncbi:hypothetical protein [Anaerocolumna sp. MB42-C2]|uniref:hypothetical protein n=1 Tax=Anaerocolumna sp. MB42-C2 TaxID=3070997 RepID=UPI0027E00E1E|nr:hypothetical protein [Anaerocolumna sp. MB42-C2]WMJ86639.1 hypothetical protein RBU59_21745 [Anaerocolumna sp. MB42-C2]
MQDKIRRFMVGRYGVDDLGKFLMWIAIIIMLPSVFFRNRIIEIIPFIILIISYVRVFSRNINQRYNENQKFLAYKRRFLGYFQSANTRRMQKKNYHVYVCPTCKQKIRVPKGKGKICITCPKCKAEFIRRS